jgi:HlyD family secretion protein
MKSRFINMGKKKNRHTGFGIIAVSLTAAVVLVAAGLYNHPVSAQSPGINSTKSKNPLPTSAAILEPGKPKAFIVAKGQITKELLLTGELKAARSIAINAPDIRSSFSNTVTFLAPEGAQIKEGERIVEFDDSNLLSQQSEAERTLDEAKLSIEKKKADLEAQRCDLLNSLAQAESDLKVDELYGKIDKELLPANTYQQYQLNLEKSKLALQKAREQLDNFEKNYASEMSLVEISKSQAEINLKKIVSDMSLLKIDAPQDGILIYGDNWTSNRKIQAGDNLFRGMEVASLPDLSSMQVIGHVYDTEYSSLARDMRCTVSFDALTDFEVGGRITALTNVASRKGFASEMKVFQATIQLDKVDTQLMKPGMTARVRIPIVLAKEAPAIPREYIGTDNQGRDYVYKGTDAKSASVEYVALGAIGDRLVQIISGVSVGDSLLPVQHMVEE